MQISSQHRWENPSKKNGSSQQNIIKQAWIFYFLLPHNLRGVLSSISKYIIDPILIYIYSDTKYIYISNTLTVTSLSVDSSFHALKPPPQWYHNSCIRHHLALAQDLPLRSWVHRAAQAAAETALSSGKIGKLVVGWFIWLIDMGRQCGSGR